MKRFDPIPRETESVARIVVDACFRVHAALGPGLLESVYEECLAFELEKRGVEVSRVRSRYLWFTKAFALMQGYG